MLNPTRHLLRLGDKPPWPESTRWPGDVAPPLPTEPDHLLMVDVVEWDGQMLGTWKLMRIHEF